MIYITEAGIPSRVSRWANSSLEGPGRGFTGDNDAWELSLMEYTNQKSFPLRGMNFPLVINNMDKFLDNVKENKDSTYNLYRIDRCQELEGFIRLYLEKSGTIIIGIWDIYEYQLWAEFDTVDNALLAKLEIG